jgi:hypothetical protein
LHAAIELANDYGKEGKPSVVLLQKAKNKFDTIWTYGESAFPPLQVRRARALRGIVAVPANRLFFRFPTKARRHRHGGTCRSLDI